ncbi:MAG: MFS transporter [Promethearchaeota archaeon]
MEEIITESPSDSLKRIIRDGYLSKIMVILTTGPFLISFALKLGANLFLIGLLAAIPPLANLIQIPTVLLVEKIRNRRKITVISLFFYRICLLTVGFIPIFFPTELRLLFLILFLILQSIFASIGHTAWAFWMHDIIPQKKLGSFYSRRMLLSTIMGMIVSILAGYFLDFWELNFYDIELYAFSILFFIAFFFGMLSIYLISKIFEPKMVVIEEKLNFSRMLSEPFMDKNYRNLLIFLFLWNFTANLTVPFFTIYMLSKLNLDLFYVVVFIAISQITNLVFLKLWGNLSDKYSNKSVLGISCPLFLICILAWVFTSLPDSYFLTLPILFLIHICYGISIAGITLAISNINMKLSPKGKANWYLAITTVVTSIALGISPIIGGILADFFKYSEFSWSLNWTSQNGTVSFQILNLQGIDFFFIIAFFIGLLSIHRLSLIAEEGEVNNKIILSQLILEIRKNMKILYHLGKPQEPIIIPLSIFLSKLKRNLKKKKKINKISEI